MGWLVDPVGFKSGSSTTAQGYEHHYIGLLEYIIDREDAVNIFEFIPDKHEFYKLALEYAKEEGVKTYGVLLHGEAEDLLDMIGNEEIRGLEFQKALVSKTNIN